MDIINIHIMFKSILISSFLLSNPSAYEHPIHSFLEGVWIAEDAKLKSVAFNKNGDAYFTFANSKTGSMNTSVHQKVDSLVLLNRQKFRGYLLSPNLFGKYEDNKTPFEIQINSADEITLFINKQEIVLRKKEKVSIFK
jgi:hypothetical protein